ncbi:TetR/AcrR family transcriptional regulator [Salisediminibacterium selenitireducens]|uniref:Transcriptional regulator, TetR family n=1 Tax=Bacillus selenitireducens (strain ATCC 700615 / DSM 15326 / MLS10) TaxID=439292 RepID=D6Y0K1_BACIE|nr:TetR/AcrR family transcriptional regulator [Salisediminibacterium selenitireducens]ADI00569.1 transcriptional regulator, TetR family [[Bacillus] selenitireducens MLS10]
MTPPGRKEIQRQRMWTYFLDAAAELIEEEGPDQVTIRKIAAKAGFTSSTAYNYFQDLSHLKFFTAMRFTKRYAEELPVYLERGSNIIDKWLYAWECFCKHSFEEPSIYAMLFMDHLGVMPQVLIDDYYEVFQDDLSGLPEPVKAIMTEHSFAKRSALYIQAAADEGFMTEADIELIAEMTLMIWKGMMNTVLSERRTWTKEEAARQALYLIEQAVMRTVASERRSEITFRSSL